MASERTAFGPITRTLAVLCGAVLWAALFAFVGAWTQRAWIGAACGAAVGAIIGYGFTRNMIGRVVVWVSVFGVLGAVLGPGCDADPATSALAGTIVGGLLGWFGWTGALMLVFGILGLNLGAALAGGFGAIPGMVLGPALAWLAVQLDRRTAAKEKDNGNIAPPGAPLTNSKDA